MDAVPKYQEQLAAVAATISGSGVGELVSQAVAKGDVTVVAWISCTYTHFLSLVVALIGSFAYKVITADEMSLNKNKRLFEATTLDVGGHGRWTLAGVLTNMDGGEGGFATMTKYQSRVVTRLKSI